MPSIFFPFFEDHAMLTGAEQERDASCEIRFLVRCGRTPVMHSLYAGAAVLERGHWVVCRTARGIELGEVLAEIRQNLDGEQALWEDAKWIRGAREEDRFLLQQLETLSREACAECQRILDARQSEDVLIDVEPLLDGKTLFFHFLGAPSEETESVIEELAEAYQESVASSRFAALLEAGCGPGCGTPEKSGCGSAGGCAVCSLAGGCTSTKKTRRV